MKLTKLSLGCALVTGLMAFAPVQSQAVVIANNLYSPLNVKFAVSYVSGSNKTAVIKTVAFTGKDVLKDAGFTSHVSMAVAANNDVVVLYQNGKTTTVAADLSTGTTTASAKIILTPLISITKTNNGATLVSQAGIIEFVAYKTATLTTNSAAWVDLKGTYSKTVNTSKTVNGKYTSSVSLKAAGLSGVGADTSLISTTPLPTTGSGSATGSGKLTPPI